MQDDAGARLEEMDLEGVLSRHPGVALVDELAHANVPGLGRNAKRWQDVLDLLDAGIDVIIDRSTSSDLETWSRTP